MGFATGLPKGCWLLPGFPPAAPWKGSESCDYLGDQHLRHWPTQGSQGKIIASEALNHSSPHPLGFAGGTSDKEPARQCRRHKKCGLDPWVGKIPWRRKWQPILVFLPGESYGQRSLVGCSPGVTKSGTTECAHIYTYLHYLLIHFSMEKNPIVQVGCEYDPEEHLWLLEIRWKDLWPQLSFRISLEDVKTLSK